MSRAFWFSYVIFSALYQSRLKSFFVNANCINWVAVTSGESLRTQLVADSDWSHLVLIQYIHSGLVITPNY